MIRPQLILDIHDKLIVDNFAGGGGWSTGEEMALGRHVDHAINHARDALGMHRINHPQTVHHCEDVFDIDPLVITEGRPVGHAHFSPDCKHFSKAKGGKPLDKRIRGLAFVILRWAKIRPDVITMENVEEIKTWGPLDRKGRPIKEHIGRTWDAFRDALGGGIRPDHPDIDEMLDVLGGSVTREDLVRGFGYDVQTRELRACDYGSPTIRRRLYMIARCDGLPIVWPKPTHAAPEKARKLGLQPYRTVAEQIDWSIPCNSIFLTAEEARKFRCRRPLKPATLRRIARGIDRYVLKASKPFLVNLTHQGGDRIEGLDEPSRVITGANRGEKGLVSPTIVNTANSKTTGRGPNAWPAEDPARTITAAPGQALATAEMAPFISEHANASSPRNMPIDEPGRTQCAEVKGGHFSLVAPTIARVDQASGASRNGISPVDEPVRTVHTGNAFGLVAASLLKLRGKPDTHPGCHPADEPAATVVAGANHHGLAVAYLAQHNAGNATNPGHPPDEPASTISSKGSQQQVVTGNLAAYFGNEQDGQGLVEPCRTVTTKDRFGLCQSKAVNHGLTPEQLAGAMRVAAFLREHGVEFEGEFATLEVDGVRFVIVDIGMRMLTPRELFRCQGFPESYVIDRAWLVDPRTGSLKEIVLTKEQQIRMCGNSVCPQVAAAICAANLAHLSILTKRERLALAPA